MIDALKTFQYQWRQCGVLFALSTYVIYGKIYFSLIISYFMKRLYLNRASNAARGHSSSLNFSQQQAFTRQARIMRVAVFEALLTYLGILC